MSTINLKLLPFSARAEVAIGDVDAISITPTVTRAAAPLPPGKVRVNGSYWPDGGDLSGDAVLTWASRIRTAQSGFAVVHQDANSVAGTIEGSYTVEVLIGGVVVALRTQTGLIGTSFTYAYADRVSDDADATKLVKFRITPVNGALVGTVRTTDSFKMLP
jgi:hypothetical protein